MLTRTGLLIVLALAAMLIVGCSSSDQAAITLTDFENIGFTKAEDITSIWDYQGLSESWDGAITVNGTSQFLEVLIFDNAPDEFNKDQFEALGQIVSARTGVIRNVMFACHAQEVCDYVSDKLR
jgi:major membrane immunogen (membrane-anchored lipoprotein)